MTELNQYQSTNSDKGGDAEGRLINKNAETFRDRSSHIDKEGKRVWIHPKKPRGRYHRDRAWVAAILVALMIGMPLIKIDGRPFMLLDIINRQFIIFGMPFWPQDFYIFAIAFLALVIFVVLFTAVFGRVWCGWACPQTIFMEMVFRKIEYWIDGDAREQRALTKSPWNGTKIRKRLLKHGIFFIMSFLISNIFLSYIIGVDKLKAFVTEGPFVHSGTFVALLIFSGVFYFVFSWFREQACTFVCPYGRLQSVLLDKNSIVVAYDYKRGEPRMKFTKDRDAKGAGDCVECQACVKVCPTGIDIRNGTQLECVNCTACMDACDEVMLKVNKPVGLIRYTSENMIESKQKFKFTPRIALYTTALVALLGIMSFLLITRSDVEATILRAKGSMFQFTQDKQIENVYTATIINKTFNPMPVEFKLLEPEGSIQLIGDQNLKVDGQGMLQTTMIIKIPQQFVHGTRSKATIGIYSGGKMLYNETISFPGPITGLRR